MSRLDVVIFGATGFTGKHAAAEMGRIAEQRGLSWGVAGRSRRKLQNTLKEISDRIGKNLSGTGILVANVESEQALNCMCSQARVLVNCCGPYTLYGEPVVKAAIHSKTHYVDCSGEPNFIELMQLKYDQEARSAGVYIISACGFESIPTDLGVLFLQQNFGGILNSVECYMSVNTIRSSINKGTWHSLLYGLSHLKQLPGIRKKLYPTPLPDRKPKLKFRFPIHKRSDGWWVWLPGNDSSSVYRTQRYFYEKDRKRPAQIKTYTKSESLLKSLGIALCIVFAYIMSHFKVTRDLLLKYSSAFSGGTITDGPPEEVIDNVEFEIKFYGVGWEQSEAEYVDVLPPRKTMLAKVFGKNPGYGMTVMGMLYSAVAILEEPDKMPSECGVVTPGIAFSRTKLVKHLQLNGVNFEIVDLKDRGY